MSRAYFENEEFFKDKDLTYSRDDLTKVFNRATIFEYMDYLHEKKMAFSMIICDIDNFKSVNDSYGHVVGDAVLKKSSAELQKVTEKIGVVGRFGGDEFIVVVPGVNDYDETWTIARTIANATGKFVIDELNGAFITFTLGISRYPFDGDDIKTILEKADKALYRGKQKGRNCFIIYLQEKHANINISDSGAKSMNPVDIQLNISRILTHSNNVKDNVHAVLTFLCNNLMIDHICLQMDGKIVDEAIYSLSYVKEFKPIDVGLIERNTNSNGICIINNVDVLNKVNNHRFRDFLLKNKITGCVYIKIECFGVEFGHLRADATSPNGRIWQQTDLQQLVVFTQIFGLLLYYNKCKNQFLED